MKMLDYGTVPSDLEISEPYDMWLTSEDELLVCKIINQGIDSHLEAVYFNDLGVKDHKRHLQITDSKSMRCFLRRLCEHDNYGSESESDDGASESSDLASCIMSTLGYEWV